jgi:hypothetical protein
MVANNSISILTIKASFDIGAELRFGKPAIDVRRHPTRGAGEAAAAVG